MLGHHRKVNTTQHEYCSLYKDEHANGFYPFEFLNEESNLILKFQLANLLAVVCLPATFADTFYSPLGSRHVTFESTLLPCCC